MLPNIIKVSGYDSDSTRLCVFDDVLMFEAVSVTGVALYLVQLIRLTPDEISLADGRFKNFKVNLRANEIVHYFEPITSAVSYQELIKKQIEWVANETRNTPLTWGMSFEALNSNKLENHFFFSDDELAVYFKLYWS